MSPSLHRALAHAEKILPGRPAPDGQTDPRWQAIIRVGQFIESHPEEVWQFTLRWARHPQADLRAAVATCLLEHLLEHHFDALFPHVRREALVSPRLADTLRRCWTFGQSDLPRNKSRLTRLKRELEKCHARSKH